MSSGFACTSFAYENKIQCIDKPSVRKPSAIAYILCCKIVLMFYNYYMYKTPLNSIKTTLKIKHHEHIQHHKKRRSIQANPNRP